MFSLFIIPVLWPAQGKNGPGPGGETSRCSRFSGNRHTALSGLPDYKGVTSVHKTKSDAGCRGAERRDDPGVDLVLMQCFSRWSAS